MRKWDEFSLMLHFLPFAPFFFTSLRKRYMFLPVFYFSLFPVVLATFFLLGSFFQFTKCWNSHVPKVIPWLGSLLESSTCFPLVQNLKRSCEVALLLPVFLFILTLLQNQWSLFSLLLCWAKFLLETLFRLDVDRRWPCLVFRQPLQQSPSPALLLLAPSVGIPQDGALVLFRCLYVRIHSNNFYHIDIDSKSVGEISTFLTGSRFFPPNSLWDIYFRCFVGISNST